MMTAIRTTVPEDEIDPGEPENAPWSTMEMLVAGLIDEVRGISWAYAQSHSKGSVPKPEQVARPGVGRRRRRPKYPISIQKLKEMDPRLRDLPDEEAIAKYREMTGDGRRDIRR
jgi:hypothetical protein